MGVLFYCSGAFDRLRHRVAFVFCDRLRHRVVFMFCDRLRHRVVLFLLQCC